jgi:hypothetical protein
MPYEVYKLIHLLGILLIFIALAGMTVHAASGRPKADNALHRTLLIFHGIGALVALTGGFGLLARVGVDHGQLFPGWVWGKLLLWIILGGAIALPYRNQGLARVLLFLLPGIGLLGAYLASYKPF